MHRLVKGFLVSVAISTAIVLAATAILHALDILELDTVREDLVLGPTLALAWLVLTGAVYATVYLSKEKVGVEGPGE